MKSIEKLKINIENINLLFKNCYLNRIQCLTNTDFLFGFSKGKDSSLIISLNSKDPFISIINKKYLINIQNSFLTKIRTKLLNAKFNGASIENNDNIVALNFTKTTDTYDKIEYVLYIELFKINGNIVLVSNELVNEAYRFKGLDTKNPLLQNMKFVLPHLDNKQIKEIDYDELFVTTYLNDIEGKYLNQKYKFLTTSIKSKIKSLNRKLEKLKLDSEKANNKLIYRECADYLLTNPELIKKGDKFVEFNNMQIPLKDNIEPYKNIEYLYRLYKKAKQTITMTNTLLSETENEIEYLQNTLDQISFFNEDDYLELIDEFKSNKLISIKGENLKNKKNTPAKMPYFIIFDNVKIGFGKNNYQNDQLTFTHAKKNYFFLHVDKSHGPHVVIFDENPKNSVKEMASEIALYLAKLSVGDVIYTQVKNVKKMGTLGKVKLLSYTTFHITKFKYDIKTEILKAKRF